MSPLQARRLDEKESYRTSIRDMANKVTPLHKLEQRRLEDGRIATFDALTKTWRVA